MSETQITPSPATPFPATPIPTTLFKAVSLSGMSHNDGTTEWVTGQTIEVLEAPKNGESYGIGLHASPTLLDAVGYQTAPSRYLRVYGEDSDLCGKDAEKSRYTRLVCGEYLLDEEADAIAGFKLFEANHVKNPFLIEANPNLDTLTLLKLWASVYDSVSNSVSNSVYDSVYDSVSASVWDSVSASVSDSVWASVGDSVCDSVRASVYASVKDSVYASVWSLVYDSVWDFVSAYIGGLFPSITVWKDIRADKLPEGVSASDPWRPLLALWCGGYVPSFDGTVWRLHSDKDARIVLTWDPITDETTTLTQK